MTAGRYVVAASSATGVPQVTTQMPEPFMVGVAVGGPPGPPGPQGPPGTPGAALIDDTAPRTDAAYSSAKVDSSYVATPPAATNHFYVHPTAGNDTNNGCSWGKAFATIGAAAAALGGSAGVVELAPGTHTVTTALPNTSGVQYLGSGRDATTVQVTSGSLLAPTGLVQGLRIEAMTIKASGSHMFNLASGGGLAHCIIRNCDLRSLANASSIIRLSGNGSYQEVTIEDCALRRNSTATVPCVDIVDTIGGANGNRFNRLTIYGTTDATAGNCTTSPAIRIEAATTGSFAYDNSFTDIVGEQNPGGLIHLYSSKAARLENVVDWDSTVAYADHVIRLDKSPTNSNLSYDPVIINAGRRAGSLGAGIYDINAPSTVAKNVVIIGGSNSTTNSATNGGDVVLSPTGLNVFRSLVVASAFSPNASVKPTFASSDGLLMQDGVSGYTASLLAFRTFTSTVNRSTIDGAGNIRWGDGVSAVDTRLSRAAAEVVVVGDSSLTATKGSFKTGRGATGSRPSASGYGAGAQWFDTTLNKPIWSDGSSWRDATGTVV